MQTLLFRARIKFLMLLSIFAMLIAHTSSISAQPHSLITEAAYSIHYENVAGADFTNILHANASRKSVTTALTTFNCLLRVTTYSAQCRRFYYFMVENPSVSLLVGRQFAAIQQIKMSLCRPWFGAVNSSGQILLRRERNADDMAARIMSDVVARLPLDRPGRTRLSVHEADLDGAYTARYTQQDRKVIKTKLAYVYQPDAPVLHPSGNLCAVYNPDGMLASVTSDEMLSGFLRGRNVSKSHTLYSAHLIQCTQKTPSGEIAGAFAQSEDASPDALQAAANRAAFRQTLGSSTGSSLLRDVQNMQAMNDQERVRILRQLEALFALEPNTIPFFAPLMTSHILPVRSTVIRALAECGNRQAQVALCGAVRSLAANTAAALDVLAAVGSLQNPAVDIENALRFLSVQPRLDASIRQMALFALGALVRNIPEGERRKRIVADLTRRLRSARSVDAKSDLLLALGNTGQPPLREVIDFAVNPNARLRRSAICALRFSAGKGDALPVMQRALLSDAEAGVREEAIQSLSFQMSAATSGLFRKACRSEKKSELRLLLLRCLSNDLSSRDNVKAIAAAAHSDANADVRRSAETMLTAMR